MTRLSFSPSGTSPRTMRCASPSTIAVLPTPGSPISTGLFLVRRDKHLDHPANLVVPADHGIELAFLRQLGQVSAILLQRLVFVFRVRVSHALSSPNPTQCLINTVFRHAMTRQEPGSAAVRDVKHAEQQMLRADVLVGHLAGVLFGLLQHLAQAAADDRLGAVREFGQAFELGRRLAPDLADIYL